MEMIRMMSGLLFDNMKQRSKLEVMERDEATRREENEKSEFVNSLLCYLAVPNEQSMQLVGFITSFDKVLNLIIF